MATLVPAHRGDVSQLQHGVRRGASRLVILLSVLGALSIVAAAAYGYLTWTRTPPEEAWRLANAAADKARGARSSVRFAEEHGLADEKQASEKTFADAEREFVANLAIVEHSDLPPTRVALLQAKWLEALGETKRAMKLMLDERCHDDQRLGVETNLVMGRIAYRSGEYKGAMLSFRTVANIAADNLEAQRWLTQIYGELGALGRQETHANQWIRLAPDDYLPHVLLANEAYSMDNFSKAATHYADAAARSMPEVQLASVKCRHAICLARTAMADEADAVLSELTTVPNQVRADYELAKGEVRLQQGLLDEAGADIDRLIEVLRDHESDLLGEALSLSLRIAEAKGDQTRIAAIAKELIVLVPSEPTAYLQLARALGAQGKKIESEQIMKKGEEIRELRTRFTEMHEEASSKTLDPVIRYQLSNVALRLGNQEAAETWYRAARRLDPKGAHMPRDLALPDESELQSP